MTNKQTTIITIIATILLGSCVVVSLTAGGYLWLSATPASSTSTPIRLAQATSYPTFTATTVKPNLTATPTPTLSPTQTPAPSVTPSNTPLPTETATLVVLTPTSSNTPIPPTATPFIPPATPTPAPPTATPTPSFSFTVLESAQFPTNHLNFDVYVAITDPNNTPLGGYRVIGNHSAGIQVDSQPSADDWTVNSGAMHYKGGNMKYEALNSPAGIWHLQLVDGAGQPVAPPLDFTFDPANPTWYFVLYRQTP